MFISIDDVLTFLETFLCLSFTFNRCTGSSSLGHTTAQVWTGRLMSLKLQVKKSDGGRMRVKKKGVGVKNQEVDQQPDFIHTLCNCPNY